MSALGAILGAGASIVGSIFGRNSARRQQQREMNFNAEQAQLNRDFQREERLATQDFNVNMWNMANEYNSPANQLLRAQEAGINPNAVVGGMDNSSAGVVSSYPMSGSQASYSGSIADSLLTLNPELALMAANTMKTLSEKESIDIANDFAPQLNDATLKKCYAEVDKIAKDAGFTEEQTRQMKELFPLLRGKNEVEIKKMQEEINNLFEQRKQIAAQTANIDSNTANVEEDTKLKHWENSFIEKFGVSPNAGAIQALMQLLTSGDKGANIAQAMLNTMFNTATGMITGAAHNVGKGLKWLATRPFAPISQFFGNTYDRLSSIWHNISK